MSDSHTTRISILDASGGVSVSVEPSMGVALVAALATDPSSLEGLLRAADAIYMTASHIIMGSLIAYDQHEMLWRRGMRPPRPTDTSAAWPIVDKVSFECAQQPASAGLLWIDLVRHWIGHRDLLSVPMTTGEVPIFDGKLFLPRTVTYDIRGRWEITPLEERLSNRS